MPSKFKIAAAMVGSVIAYDMATRPLRTKYAEIARVAIKLDKENTVLKAQRDYLVNLINENQIELSEFDFLVLNSVMKA